MGGLLAFVGGMLLLFLPPAPPKTYDYHLIDGYSLTTMGSKTAYRNNGLFPMRARFDTNGTHRLIQLNALFRHGTRAPDLEFAEEMRALGKKLKKL